MGLGLKSKRRPSRVLELAHGLQLTEKVDGARKLAAHFREPALEQQLTTLLEWRMDADAAADAAAAAPPLQQVRVAGLS